MATAKTEAPKTMGINEKLSAIQTQIKAPKNLYNKFGEYYYRNAESILESAKPFLKELGLFLTINDSIEVIGERYYIKATAILVDCETGESIAVSAYAREALEKPKMDASQITGSTSSYARKYALNGLFLLDDTKDPDTDEFHKQTTKTEQAKPNQKKENDAERVALLKNLWTEAGGKEGFDDWVKSKTENGFTQTVFEQMKASLMAKIKKDQQAKENKA